MTTNSDTLDFSEKKFIFITGLPRTGKTSFMLMIAERFRNEGRNLVYYSPADDRIPPKTVDCDTMEEFEQTMMDTPEACGLLDECWTEMEPQSYNKFLFAIGHSKRHMRMDLVFNCQSPSDIDVVFRKMADHIYVFRLSQEDSLWMGKHPAIAPDVSEITQLPDLTCIRYDKNPPRRVKRIDIRTLKP